MQRNLVFQSATSSSTRKVRCAGSSLPAEVSLSRAVLGMYGIKEIVMLINFGRQEYIKWLDIVVFICSVGFVGFPAPPRAGQDPRRAQTEAQNIVVQPKRQSKSTRSTKLNENPTKLKHRLIKQIKNTTFSFILLGSPGEWGGIKEDCHVDKLLGQE